MWLAVRVNSYWFTGLCVIAALAVGVTTGRYSATDSIIGTDLAQENEILQQEYLEQLIANIDEPDEFDRMCWSIMDTIDEYRRNLPPDTRD